MHAACAATGRAYVSYQDRTCYHGFKEYRVGSGAKAEPDAVVLADLEKGIQSIDNNHITVGEHVAFYGAALYEYKKSKYASGGPKPTSKVNHAYYPIISAEHPFMQALGSLAEEYGGLENVPEGTALPAIDQFSILVKTSRFKTINSIPDGLEEEKNVQGLIINRIKSLDSKEVKLIKQSFPNLNLKQVLILDQGRKPTSVIGALAIIFGGLVLAFGSVAWLFSGGGKKPAPARRRRRPARSTRAKGEEEDDDEGKEGEHEE